VIFKSYTQRQKLLPTAPLTPTLSPTDGEGGRAGTSVVLHRMGASISVALRGHLYPVFSLAAGEG